MGLLLRDGLAAADLQQTRSGDEELAVDPLHGYVLAHSRRELPAFLARDDYVHLGGDAPVNPATNRLPTDSQASRKLSEETRASVAFCVTKGPFRSQSDITCVTGEGVRERCRFAAPGRAFLTTLATRGSATDMRSGCPGGFRPSLTAYDVGRNEVIIRLISRYSGVPMYSLAFSRYGSDGSPGVSLFTGL